MGFFVSQLFVEIVSLIASIMTGYFQNIAPHFVGPEFNAVHQFAPNSPGSMVFINTKSTQACGGRSLERWGGDVSCCNAHDVTADFSQDKQLPARLHCLPDPITHEVGITGMTELVHEPTNGSVVSARGRPQLAIGRGVLMRFLGHIIQISRGQVSHGLR